MTELKLACVPATHGLELPVRPGLLAVAESADLARYVLRGGDVVVADVLAALDVRGGLPLNRAVAGPCCAALRLGPDEWWLLAATADAAPLADRVREAARGRAHALVDVGHRNVALQIEGRAAVEVLAAGCPQPLDVIHFPVDRCSRTVYAKAQVVLWRRAEDHFHVETERSFAPYLVGCLAREAVHLAP